MSTRRLFQPALLAIIALSLAGCLNTSSEATFIDGRQLNPCSAGSYLVCKGNAAGCILDDRFYLSGTFPGERKFLVTTPQGDWKIQISVFLMERLSPGTETIVSWYEPGCTDEYVWRLSEDKLAGDLFERAGRDQTFEVEHPVVEAGDHLVTVWSDAVARYHLRATVLKQDN